MISEDTVKICTRNPANQSCFLCQKNKRGAPMPVAEKQLTHRWLIVALVTLLIPLSSFHNLTFSNTNSI